MAHDACPYLRITGTTGELVISGTGLQANVQHAGGLRLYNPQYPQGKEMLGGSRDNDADADDADVEEPPPRTDFFMAFRGLWDDIRRIHRDRDDAAAHDTVLRAIEDVRTVLAIYKSAQTRQWESTEYI
jgi:hypothetical protein